MQSDAYIEISDHSPSIGERQMTITQPQSVGTMPQVDRIASMEQRITNLEQMCIALAERTWWSMLKDFVKTWWREHGRSANQSIRS